MSVLLYFVFVLLLILYSFIFEEHFTCSVKKNASENSGKLSLLSHPIICFHDTGTLTCTGNGHKPVTGGKAQISTQPGMSHPGANLITILNLLISDFVPLVHQDTKRP